jgi:tetraacyldisaccharide 4'-kinase
LGQTHGACASVARFALRLASFPYALTVRLRNRLYDSGWRPTYKVEVPVVSVGNLTVGGTGKTPIVEMLGRWFRQRGVRTVVLSRGYGATDGANDEALVLEDNLPDVPHLQGPDRVELARLAQSELGCQLVILDDGFQHRRLARDLDVVLIDSTHPFGGGWMLPGGLLREPVRAVSRAHLVVLTRCDHADLEARRQIRAHIAQFAGSVPWVDVRFAPRDLLQAGHAPEPVLRIRGIKVVAFCGIGNPEAFRRTLTELGAAVVGFRSFPDHYNYSRNDVSQLVHWVAAERPQAVLTTQKDWVKIRLETLADVPLLAVRIEAQVTAGQDQLESALSRIVKLATVID